MVLRITIIISNKQRVARGMFKIHSEVNCDEDEVQAEKLLYCKKQEVVDGWIGRRCILLINILR